MTQEATAQEAPGQVQRDEHSHVGSLLGPILCWAVVFADIGTSVYYVPGILYGHFGSRSALFVLMTLFVFILLCVKYAEVTWRYPEGGGVVNVSSQRYKEDIARSIDPAKPSSPLSRLNSDTNSRSIRTALSVLDS